jgi:tetratricopeptide (TPR) repeat protein
MSFGEAGSPETLLLAPGQQRSKWIISPVADLVLLIATPLVIVPLTLLVACRYFSIEHISLFAIAFASLGHQLPGFIRAYGDPVLFSRYRWRMLLGPVVAFLVAWFVSQTELHGLVLLLLLWSTWHVLMQTYGMLRIYDLKQGRATASRARFDFWVCLALFVWGFVSSESRLFMLAETAWRIGLPMLTTTGAELLHWLVNASALCILVVYLCKLTYDFRAGQLTVSKLLLLMSTGCLYWLCGSAGIPILLGVAMFELFHAIQYDALVWVTDRHLGSKLSRRWPLLRTICEQRSYLLLLYVIAIGVFGAVRLLPDVITEPHLKNLLLATITASTLMHFYFDGFIWKVSAPQQMQTDDRLSRGFAGLRHAGKCVGLALIVAGLLIWETQHPPAVTDEAEWLAQAATWGPNLADVQSRRARAQVKLGDMTGAIVSARRAITLLPNSADAYADLGAILMRADHYHEAALALEQANRLAPERWQQQLDLGLAQTHLANWSAAEQAFVLADRIAPQNTLIQRGWADLELARGDATAAVERLQVLIDVRSKNAVEPTELDRHWITMLSAAGQNDLAVANARLATISNSESTVAWHALGQALNAARRFEQAIPPLKQAIALGASDADVRYQLGLAQVQQGDLIEGRRQLQLALKADARHAQAWFQQANIAFTAGDYQAAAHDYRRSISIKPRWAEAHSNLGAVLFSQQHWAEATAEFQRALELSPDHASAHYNLGLLLLKQQDFSGARRHLLRAGELGQPCSSEVAKQLGIQQ